MEDNDFLREIKESFIFESQDLLIEAEENFLSLEKNPDDPKIIECIFRLAHNLKGASKAVGYDCLSDFCHEFENLLVAIKNGDIKVSPSIVDLLLKCNDRLIENIETLKDNLDASVNNSDLITEINTIMNGGEVTEEATDEANKEEPQEKELSEEERYDAVIAQFEQEIQDLESKENKNMISDLEGEINRLEVNEKETDKIIDELKTSEEKAEEKELPSQVKKEEVKEEVKQEVNEVKEEKQLSEVKTQKKKDEFIKVSLSKIDNLLNYFGEQVILQSTLEFAKGDLRKNEDIMQRTISQLSKITYDLQQTAISLRMLSIKTVFSKMERIVRDTSRNLGKKIEFIKSGEDNELDKTIIEAIVDPLTHMIRNSVDHGIEPNDQREKLGKNSAGKVWMNAFHRGGFFYIEVKDDGKGLDKEKILLKAIKLGLVDKNKELSDKEIYELIFSSGFSTKEKASDLSGRGVGMDVVKDAITRLKGTCEVNSVFGEGTTFTIKLPLTLAIFNGMVIGINDNKYIMPNSDIEEIIPINSDMVRQVNEKEKIVEIKNTVVPIIEMDRFLGKLKRVDEKRSEKRKFGNNDQVVLLTSYRNKKYAFLIDELISQQRIVHKNLGMELENTPGVTGGTILGDGKVALILGANSIIEKTRGVA